MEMTYTKAGDYLVPNVRLNNREMKPLGKYGQMRKKQGYGCRRSGKNQPHDGAYGKPDFHAH